MKAFFKDLFDYHNYFNQLLIDIFNEHSSALSDRTIPLFSHCLNAHQIWNSRILKTQSFGVHQLHPLEDLKAIDSDNHTQSLKIIDTFDFNEIISYSNSKGETYKNTIQDILFHIINHFTHHKGQLISDLRMNHIEPPVTDYIFYKR